MSKFGIITHMAQDRVSWGQPRPYLKGAGPNYWDLLHARTQYEKRQLDFAWLSN